jgi:hypothetical protein
MIERFGRRKFAKESRVKADKKHDKKRIAE